MEHVSLDVRARILYDEMHWFASKKFNANDTYDNTIRLIDRMVASDFSKIEIDSISVEFEKIKRDYYESYGLKRML